MNFPWNHVFEYFRDRQRGALFFCGLGVFLVVVTVGAVVMVRACGSETEPAKSPSPPYVAMSR